MKTNFHDKNFALSLAFMIGNDILLATPLKCSRKSDNLLHNWRIIGHFQVAVDLSIKARLSAKLFTLKLVSLFAYE